jgi:septal ring factor EnvC (AmiA/AmiB activator)
MRSLSVRRRVVAMLAGFAAFVLAATASAQAPPPSPEAAEIGACVCLHRSLDAVRAEMAAKTQALDQQRAQLAQLDAQVAQQRSQVDVNNPESVSRFKLLLEKRDAAAKASNGLLVGEADAATAAYNDRVGQYNARCAGHPFDPVLMSQIQATVTCPAP